MGQPAHDGLVLADDLLPIDAEILPLLVRPSRDDQRPGDQWSGIARPAGLDRIAAQVDLVAGQHHFLTGRMADGLGRHVQHLLEQRQLVEHVAKPLGRLRFLEECQQPAHLAQGSHRVLPHAQRHPLRRAEQVAQQRHVMALGLLEQQRRPAGLQRAVADFGDLQMRIGLVGDALELADGFQMLDEVAQVVVFHGVLSVNPVSEQGT